ncbi:hypothetical protein TNCV_940201 [Trichonephila clavipes]|nr:hypothetical protein TNCV_940201 [Trichonephila clavipes]
MWKGLRTHRLISDLCASTPPRYLPCFSQELSEVSSHECTDEGIRRRIVARLQTIISQTQMDTELGQYSAQRCLRL